MNKSIKGSQLVRCLSELSVSDVQVTHNKFAEKLGNLVDLSGSIALSQALKNLSSRTLSGADQTADVLQSDFLDQRMALIQSINRNFSSGTGFLLFRAQRNKLNSDVTEAVKYQVYQRFYLSQQNTLGSKVHALHSHVRDAIVGHSPKLMSLAALDRAMSDCLSEQTRKSFSVVPSLLAKRFNFLQTESMTANWLDTFQHEMQQVLLAELEVRLQPVIGLIEALNQENQEVDLQKHD